MIKMSNKKYNPKILLRNRRGEDILVDFWAILAFAIVLIIFFILFNLTKTQSTLNTAIDFQNKDAGFMLNSYLRAPYYADKDKRIGEIIIEDYMKKDYTRTRDSFKEFYSGTNNYGGFVVDSITLCIFEGNDLLQAYKFSRSATALNPKVDPTYDFGTEKEKRCDSVTSAHGEALLPKVDDGNIRIMLEVTANPIIHFVQT